MSPLLEEINIESVHQDQLSMALLETPRNIGSNVMADTYVTRTISFM